MTLKKLANLLDKLSKKTWHDLEYARSVNMHFGEVTLTQNHLLEIRRLNSAVHIVEVSQNEEKRTGADFEFWFQSKAGPALGYSIQAKRVQHGTKHHTYSQLSHKGNGSDPYQYDTLLRHASTTQSTAFHVFFNGWDLTPADAPFANMKGGAALLGCAAVPTIRVKEIREQTKRRNNKVSAYANASRPWSDLVPYTSGLLLTPSALPAPSSQTQAANSPSQSTSVTSGSSTTRTSNSSTNSVTSDLSQMALAAGHSWDMQLPIASSIPEYVKSRIGSNTLPPKDATLPRFAVLIQLN
jgi:hypothetical protein